MSRNINFIIVSMLLLPLYVFAESDAKTKLISEYSYKECLRDAMQNNKNLDAKDIRSLCREITDGPRYDFDFDFDEGKLVPMNKFTKCYERTLQEQLKKGSEKAAGVAELICHGPPE